MQQNISFIVEPRGGLCNRLRVLETTYSFAKKYHIKPTIWWRKTFELAADANALFAELPFPFVEHSDTFINSGQWNAAAMKFRAFTATLQGYRVFQQQEITALLKSGKNITTELDVNRSVYIQTYSIYFQHEETDYTWLRPNTNIISSVKNTAQLFQEKKVVGVHIRRGDHQQARSKSKDEDFVNIIKKEIESFPETVFYLATDDLHEQRNLVEKFGDKIILRPKEFSRTTNQGVADALTDVLLLSKTQKIIGSYRSSFSETAAAIGRIPLIIAGSV